MKLKYKVICLLLVIMFSLSFLCLHNNKTVNAEVVRTTGDTLLVLPSVFMIDDNDDKGFNAFPINLYTNANEDTLFIYKTSLYNTNNLIPTISTFVLKTEGESFTDYQCTIGLYMQKINQYFYHSADVQVRLYDYYTIGSIFNEVNALRVGYRSIFQSCYYVCELIDYDYNGALGSNVFCQITIEITDRYVSDDLLPPLLISQPSYVHLGYSGSALDQAYNDGFLSGQGKGYILGYDEGLNDGTIITNETPLGFFKKGIDSLMNIHLFGDITLGMIFAIIFGCVLLGLAIKIFK